MTYPRATVNADWESEIIAHSSRIVRPARATARELGLAREEVERVGLAALLHDLGKLTLPCALLEKPGPLNAEEWNLMRRHPGIGCRILQKAGGYWKSVALLVAAHHERWDGSGYPRGLAREAIPLGARILSVVDAYDAMTSSRVYQSPLSHEKAREELKRCAGQQFDPLVVEAFLQVLNRRPYERLALFEQRAQPGGKLKHLFALLGVHHQVNGAFRSEQHLENEQLDRGIASQGV